MHKIRTDTVEIIETHAMVKGLETVLFSIPGLSEGVAIDQQDIDAGLITKQQAIDSLSQMWLDCNR